MKAEDQYHAGIVVDDLDRALAELSDLFGYEWADEIRNPTSVRLPTEEVVVLDFRFRYSRSTPRLEVIQSMPGTLWVPAAGSDIHHLGYWSDDVPADSAQLTSRGYAAEATGTRPDGTPYWSFHHKEGGPRIELVSRDIQPALEQYWAT